MAPELAILLEDLSPVLVPAAIVLSATLAALGVNRQLAEGKRRDNEREIKSYLYRRAGVSGALSVEVGHLAREFMRVAKIFDDFAQRIGDKKPKYGYLLSEDIVPERAATISTQLGGELLLLPPFLLRVMSGVIQDVDLARHRLRDWRGNVFASQAVRTVDEHRDSYVVELRDVAKELRHSACKAMALSFVLSLYSFRTIPEGWSERVWQKLSGKPLSYTLRMARNFRRFQNHIDNFIVKLGDGDLKADYEAVTVARPNDRLRARFKDSKGYRHAVANQIETLIDKEVRNIAAIMREEVISHFDRPRQKMTAITNHAEHRLVSLYLRLDYLLCELLLGRGEAQVYVVSFLADDAEDKAWLNGLPEELRPASPGNHEQGVPAASNTSA